ncbi:transcription factor FapR [Massilibacterium senegalense]|uniref:transcription factor FapR n=1 Tax=Massilibacterium senegalense TaxID=1632858 RepID=UPI0007858E00|nr:transcription factor FapR [Massilibacterium senegalense]
MKRSKKERQVELKKTIQEKPFVTDEDLAKMFEVSIQTIRLDRMELAIPELRERIKMVAQKQLDELKSLQVEEVIGEIIDIELDKSGISILDIQQDHVFARTKIARGHHLFAQANSLATAIINDELALTSKATIHFVRQVHIGERVVAKARVIDAQDDRSLRTIIEVQSYVRDERVFKGQFSMYRSNEEKE